MAEEIKDKRILITGGAQGIGFGVAKVCLREGGKVLVLDREAEALEACREELGNVETHLCDLSDNASVQSAVEKIVSSGPIDALVNNAGVNSYAKDLLSATEEDWDRVLGVNLKGSWFLTKTLIPHIKDPGTIVFMSSVHSEATYPKHFPYCVTKGGISMMVKSLALDFGKRGIRALGIAPGWIRTRNNQIYLDSVEDPQGTWDKVNSAHPMGKIGEPEEIGELVSFMVSDRCPFLNGTTITVDGGLTAVLPGPSDV